MTLLSPSASPLAHAVIRPLSLIMAASLLALAPAIAQPAAKAPTAPTDAPITEAELAADMRLLSHDAFQGRGGGGSGEMRTIAQIVGSWAAAGLQPVAGSTTPWLQAVPLIDSRQISSSLIFARGGQNLAIDAKDLAIRLSQDEVKVADLPVVFIGHGMDSEGKIPSDIAGKLVLVLAGSAPFAKDPPSYLERYQRLSAAGVAGIITVVDADMPWGPVSEVHVAPSVLRDTGAASAPIDVMISLGGFDQLAKAMGRDSRALVRAAASQRFQAENLLITASVEGRAKHNRYDSHNIIAKLAGANPDGKAVILMGHWDGLGLCDADSAGDTICNGAVDNASGIAVMHAVAKRLAAGPKMDRDVYFLATAAEEKGLFGAAHFVDHPVVPLDDIIVALNLDTVAIAPRGTPVATVGRGRPSFDAKVEKVAKSLGRRIDKDGEADEFEFRQDGWAFGAKDVPALMVGGSFSDMGLLEAYMGGNYHRPGDEMSDAVPLGGAAEDGDLHVQLVRAFASRTEWPANTSKAKAKAKR